MGKNKMKAKFINSAVIDNNVGKIELWGEIKQEPDRDWWTGEVIESDVITPADFKDALAQLANVSSIELHLNSCGGDANVGILIGNMIKDSDKDFTCVVDGIAASAAFTIAMSCNTVKVHHSSILMCHEVKAFLCGYYGNEELKKVENGNETYNKATATIYAQKSGMSMTQILNLMKKETWMTGDEAVDYKFADEVVDDDFEIEFENKNMLRVNGVQCNIKGLHVPDKFLNSSNTRVNVGGQNTMSKENEKEKSLFQCLQAFFKNEADGEDKNKDQDGGEEDDKKKNKKNKTNQEGDNENGADKENSIARERERLQAIDEIASNFDAELVQEAKYGKTACTAAELALRAVQKQMSDKQNSTNLNNMQQDANESRVNQVSSTPPSADHQQNSQDEANDSMKILFDKINKINGGK